MTNFLAVLGATATILATGFGALRLALPASSRPNGAATFALSWLLGTGIVSLLVWIFGLFAKGPLLPAVVATICISLPLLARKVKGRAPISSWPLPKPAATELVLGALLAIEVAIIFYLSYAHTLGGDGILNWEIKARYAHANAGVLPAAYLRDTGRAFSHPGYPLAIPYTELWFYFWLGDTNQFWAKTIFPLFYLSGVILLATAIGRLTGKAWTGLAASALLFFVPQLSVEQGSVIVGYADFPIAVFYLATIGYLICACEPDDGGSFRIYAACLALLPWVKQEGLVLWLVATLCGIFVIIWKRKPALNFLALLPGLLVMAGWRLYLLRTHAVASADFLPLNLMELKANIGRLGSILGELGSAFMDTDRWSLFWGITGIAAIFFIRRYHDARAIVLFLAFGAPICIYSFSYVFSAWPSYILHIGLSMNRLLMHVAPLALFFVGAALPSNLPGREKTAAKTA
jgi:hypothetical protein